MTNKILSTLLLAVVLLTTTQCATSNASETVNAVTYELPVNTKIVEKTMKIKSPYSSVTAMAGIRIYYTVGKQNSMRITGPEDQVEKLVINNSDNQLMFSTKNRRVIRSSDGDGVKIYINGPLFKEASLSSGATIKMMSAVNTDSDIRLSTSSGGIFTFENKFACATMRLEASSGGIINFDNLTNDKTVVDASSGGIVTLKGSTANLVSSASSGAILNINGMASHKGSVNASSGAIVNCRGNNLSIESTSGAIVRRNK